MPGSSDRPADPQLGVTTLISRATRLPTETVRYLVVRREARVQPDAPADRPAAPPRVSLVKPPAPPRVSLVKSAAGGATKPAAAPVGAPRRSIQVLLAAIVALPAIWLRLVHLTALGYNSDEAVYAGQGLSLSGNADFLPYFPVFRAHPLLFQSTLAAVFHVVGFSEFAGRFTSVLFGLANIVVVFSLGRLLYEWRVGWLAALIYAVMPYLVVVNRQVLLDGPMTFFATLSIYLLARYTGSRRPSWLLATAAVLGLTILTKETALLLLGGVYAFFALTPMLRIKWLEIATAVSVLAAVVAVYPLSVTLSGAGSTGGHFLVWQLLRRANHAWTFYPSVVPPAIGWPVITCALGGLWFLRARRDWPESLLGFWVIGPALFFQVWSVKGFQYLLPIAAPLAILAARAIVALIDRQRVGVRRWGISGTVAGVVVGTLTVAILAGQSWTAVTPKSAGATFLAGSGGVPGGREAGTWIATHVPKGAQLLALGPSMANILQFYGHRKAYGLSVSPNPLHRNPVYEAIPNPDVHIRHDRVQYLVWDSFSASRSPFFSDQLLAYAKRYHGHIVHTESVPVTRNGVRTQMPVIVIYQVRP